MKNSWAFRVVWFYGISQFPLSTLINLCLDHTNSEFTEKWVRSEFSSQNRSCHALKYPQCFMMKYFKHEVLGGVLEQASRHYQPQPSPHKSAGFIVSFYHHSFIHPSIRFLPYFTVCCRQPHTCLETLWCGYLQCYRV